MNLELYQQKFDNYFEEYLEAKLLEVKNLFPDKEIFEIVTYLREYTKKGKRFRPYMVYLGYKVFWWKDDSHIIHVWIINELIHIFALIHDDICDQWIMRRHIPTYHKYLESKYSDAHIWMSQALLVGDLVYTRSMELIVNLLKDNALAQKVLLDMCQKVVYGQMIDVHFSFEKNQRTLEDISIKDDLKSWQYTFENPLLLWATLWWATQEELLNLKNIWKNLWIAFQMRDDLLDWIPNKEGKTNLSDIQEWNQTIVFSTMLDLVEDKDKLFAIKWKKLDSQDIDWIVSQFSTYWIMENVLSSIHQYLDIGSQEIEKIWNDVQYRTHLITMIDLLRQVD